MTIEPFIYGYIASEETYPDKAVIIEEGGKGTWVGILLEGHAKIQKKTPKGLLTLENLKEGAIFGEMGLFQKDILYRTTSVIASGGPVRIGILDYDKLVGDYELLSSQLKGLIRSLSVRLKEATEKVCTLVAK